MFYRQMTKNYIFRKMMCQLSTEETAKLCFKNASEVKEWDEGKEIPREFKRLMRMSKGRELSPCESWEQFKMHYDRMELPTGKMVTAQEILAGIALLEIKSELEIKTTTKLLAFARSIARVKEKG
ncbi:phage protein [Vibrio anguillarum]|uniref:phage protein n=1 Tax=Vibrio anguillarum TaxID=55601 RepID=UPI00097E332C|nr:phage protein [Vibrio anguillarum]MBT2911831.1 regulator [Vibrio anguillarum]MBT2944072.1 regulator [Vibrio anguillarum]MBT2951557.1 regulator [Vibrio anguillarum]